MDDIHGESESPDDVCGDEGPRRVRRRLRPLVTSGPLQIILVLAKAGGLWEGHIAAGDETCEVPMEGAMLVGLALITSWALVAASASADDTLQTMRAVLRRRSSSRQLFGYVQYPVVAAASLLNPIPVDPSLPGSGLRALVADCMVRSEANILTATALLHTWCAEGAANRCKPVFFCAALAGRVAHSLASVAHCVEVTGRVVRASLLEHADPSPAVLKRWCRENQALIAIAATGPEAPMGSPSFNRLALNLSIGQPAINRSRSSSSNTRLPEGLPPLCERRNKRDAVGPPERAVAPPLTLLTGCPFSCSACS